MSLHKYNKQLNLDLKPSNFLFYFIVFIHLLAVSVLLLGVNIHSGILMIIFFFIVISMYFSLVQNSSVKFKIYIKNIQSLKDMEWRLENSDMQSSIAELQKNWFILPWLLILYFKTNNDKNKVIIILPDMINKNELRQLKLYLNQINLKSIELN